jgi:methionine synthase II (cobalamin-independent)
VSVGSHPHFKTTDNPTQSQKQGNISQEDVFHMNNIVIKDTFKNDFVSSIATHTHYGRVLFLS